MKNPENKPLRIVPLHKDAYSSPGQNRTANDMAGFMNYGLVLSNLAIAESNLVRSGKDSALPHFIAIVKELEKLYGFKFEIVDG